MENVSDRAYYQERTVGELAIIVAEHLSGWATYAIAKDGFHVVVQEKHDIKEEALAWYNQAEKHIFLKLASQ